MQRLKLKLLLPLVWLIFVALAVTLAWAVPQNHFSFAGRDAAGGSLPDEPVVSAEHRPAALGRAECLVLHAQSPFVTQSKCLPEPRARA